MRCSESPVHAPFPFFGGKARIAPRIWDALGDVPNYVEPFAGSLAVLLAKPHAPGLETVNDKDGFICNLWRAIQHDPDAVTHYADWPSNECDLHARHSWLVPQRPALTTRLEGDPDYYDAKIAGWWLWGICCWIGSGWCSGQGTWHVVDGQLVDTDTTTNGVQRQLLHLGNAGQGVQRKRPHLGNAGQGVQRTRPHLGGRGDGMRVHAAQAAGEGLLAWMQALCQRLRRVRVCCGDWSRVMGPSVTWKHRLTGVVLDPPYSHSQRDSGLYAVEADIAHEVQVWCQANGANPLLRLVLCGLEGEYDLPGWRQITWKANGGMSNQNRDQDNRNKYREVLWLSPHCVETQLTLFGGGTTYALAGK